MKKATSLLALLAALAVAVPLRGQDPPPTILEGYVVDATTGQPVPNVLLIFEGGDETLSDLRGRYRVEGLEPGDHRVVLITSRCNSTFGSVALDPGEIRQVAFAVPSEVDPPEDPAAEARAWRRRSQGTLVTAEEIQEMRVLSLAEVIRRVAPSMVGAPAAQAGGVTHLRSRSTVSASGPVEPIVVIDGTVAGEASEALAHIPPSEVESLEILKGASAGWAYGTGGTGGVIKVVTKQGEQGYWRADPHRCEIPPFPSRESGGR